MKKTNPTLAHATAFALLSGLTSTAGADAYPMAGLNPSQRPQGAPTIVEVQRDDAWMKRARHGLSEPLPHSLRFLQDQGNWHTPFTEPGMPRPYDIRGWHTGDVKG
jgi:hypothetical protein